MTDPIVGPVIDPLADIRADLRDLVDRLRTAGVPVKLLASIERKCMRTPRRQTGRLDRRTNRQNRWILILDHPDYSTERDALLVRLRLLLDVLGMQDSPQVDRDFVTALARKYFEDTGAGESTRDPLTDEPLSYPELVEDIVNNPKHGYSRFHIGHQDPRFQPKHNPGNVRWQSKKSNDFQGTMDIRVARIAYRIDQYLRNNDPQLLEEARKALAALNLRIENPE